MFALLCLIFTTTVTNIAVLLTWSRPSCVKISSEFTLGNVEKQTLVSLEMEIL